MKRKTHETRLLEAVAPLMKPQHTPTPWSLLEANSFVICAASGVPIVEATGVNYGESGIGASAIQAANAAFIVRAVNSHDELLDFTRRLRDRWKQAGEDLTHINAVIVKAEAA